MAIGFTYTLNGTSTQAIPDKGMTRSIKPRVLVSQFGDGYQQRIADGINSINESFSISFNNRSKAEVDDIGAFLEAKKAVTKFIFTIPDTNNTSRTGERDYKVVCSEFSIRYAQGDFYSLTAKLQQVFEA